MVIYLYNTLTRQKEEFVPLEPGVATMYHCGPTVYDNVHIGNLRSFVFADTVRRVFEYNEFAVRQVMNITDVDDKTIRRAREEGVPLAELTARYEKTFWRDMDALNVKRPHEAPRATDNIKEIVTLIEMLLEKGIAYRGEDSSVYFDISKDPQYGRLAGLEGQELQTGAHNSADEYGKDDIRDFVLWKAWKPEDGDVFWETSLGKGRPGWHIECSAMSLKYLTDTFSASNLRTNQRESAVIDIHTGGEDLIFPHHTNEIAQSNIRTDGKPFANYWLHNAFITVEGKKMAKSEGNFITLEDIKKRGVTPLAYRYWLLQAHYRTPENFTWDALEAASEALKKLNNQLLSIDNSGESIPSQHHNRFSKVINDDFNTPRALAELWEVVRDKNMDEGVKKATMLDFDRVLGLGFSELQPESIPDKVQKLAEEREKARRGEDFTRADELRKEITTLGYIIDDTPEGPKIHPL